MMSAISAPTLGAQAPGLLGQQACAAHTVAEKTGDLLLTPPVPVLMPWCLCMAYMHGVVVRVSHDPESRSCPESK